MNKYNGPSSKALPTTLCQKCLKRGHFSYECKAGIQDRGYVSRPSRTQQLQNPKLLPKLTSDVPNELLRRNGVADELLAKSAEQRGRLRTRGGSADTLDSAQRSTSSTSISTISTTLSASPAPPPKTQHDSKKQNTSTRHNENSFGHKSRPSRRKRSYSSTSSVEATGLGDTNRSTRRRRASRSPMTRGRKISRSGSQSYESGVAHQDRERAAHERRRDSHSRQNITERRVDGGSRPTPISVPRPPKQRSMSPFSRRIALTQAMNH